MAHLFSTIVRSFWVLRLQLLKVQKDSARCQGPLTAGVSDRPGFPWPPAGPWPPWALVLCQTCTTNSYATAYRPVRTW